MSLSLSSTPRPDKARLLREQLLLGRIVKVVGVHDGFTALLADQHSFDALWLSGLGVSASHGLPDASILTMTDFLAAARIVDRASKLPVIADCDSGFGDVNNIVHMVREYEQAGIAAVCIEDKVFPKRNSFTDGQQLADPQQFAAKVMAAKRAQRTADFTVIARIESLTAGTGLDDALYRAGCYTEAGADAIVIHSKSKVPDEVIAFARKFRAADEETPLIVIPTTYPSVTERQLAEAGVSMVIYANQVLRAFAGAANEVLSQILGDSTAANADTKLVDVKYVLSLIGTENISANDAWLDEVTE